MCMLFLILWFKGVSDFKVTLPAENAQTLFIFAFSISRYLDIVLS